MAVNFPDALDDSVSLVTTRVTDDTIPASDHNDLGLALIAVETKLGYGDTAPTANALLKGSGVGQSAWVPETAAFSSPIEGYAWGVSSGVQQWINLSAGGGEANTGANINSAGVGVYDSKSGVQLRFRGIDSPAATLSVVLNSTNKTVEMEVIQSALSLTSIGGTLSIAKGGTGQTGKTAAFDALSPLSTLGDTIHHDGTNNVRLPGSTSAGKRFLTQTGNGVTSAAPTWAAIIAADVPTLTSSKISDLATVVQAYTLDQFAAPTGNVSMNSNKITNVTNPTADQDAATKFYVDSVATGLDLKASVRAASTANIADLANCSTSMDGVTLVQGDRILLKDQSTGSQNGIYTVGLVTTGTAPLTRSTDANTDAEVTSGMFTFVAEGTTNGNNGFVLTTDDPITLGTTALVFTQFSGAGQITAGNGLTKSGNTLNVGAGTGITVNSDDIQISASYAGQSSIVTVGTIASGVWNGTKLAEAYGGTNQNTYASGDILYASAANTLSKLAKGSDGQVLNLSSGLPAWTNPARASYDAVVAASGGDYTTIDAALTAGARRILLKGTVTQAAALTISQTDVFIEGTGTGVLVLNDTASTLAITGARSVMSGIKFDIDSTTNLATDDTAWVSVSGANAGIQNSYFDLAGVLTATVGSVVRCSGNSGVFVRDNFFIGGASLRFIINAGSANRKFIVSGNRIADFTDMTAIGAVSSGGSNQHVDVLNNHIAPTAMTATKNLIHFETTSTGTVLLNIGGNTLHCMGTYAATNRTGVYVKSGSVGSVDHAVAITGNNIGLSSSHTTFGITLDTIHNVIVSGNSCGQVSINSLLRSSITGNRIYAGVSTHSSTANAGVIIEGNTMNSLNVDKMSGGSISHNVAETGIASTFTVANTSSATAQVSIIGNSGFSGYSIDGAYCVITGNIGSGGTGAPSGTMTLAGSNLTVTDNRVAAISNSATDSTINGRLVTASSATATAANTTETDLKTYTVGAARLGINGDKIRVQFSGTTAANANTKQIKLYWAGAAGLDTTALALNGKSFSGFIEIMRSGATAQKVTFFIVSDDGTLLPAITKFVTGGATLSGTNIVKITGQNGTASAGDISLEQWDVTFVAAS